jgi:hypothetical protein
VVAAASLHSLGPLLIGRRDACERRIDRAWRMSTEYQQQDERDGEERKNETHAENARHAATSHCTAPGRRI